MRSRFPKIIAPVVLLATALTLFDCGKDSPAPAKEQVQLDKLKKTWTLVSVTLDGADKKAPAGQIETSFSLTFSGTFNSSNPKGPYNFTVTGTEAPSPWPVSGTWLFGDDAESQIIRQNDNVAISYTISPSGQLTLTFVCSGCNYPGARTETVDGTWVFVLQ